MYTTYDINLYDQKSSTSIYVTEDIEGTDLIQVKASTGYYGAMDFSIGVEEAKALATAILRQVAFITSKGN